MYLLKKHLFIPFLSIILISFIISGCQDNKDIPSEKLSIKVDTLIGIKEFIWEDVNWKGFEMDSLFVYL